MQNKYEENFEINLSVNDSQIRQKPEGHKTCLKFGEIMNDVL